MKKMFNVRYIDLKGHSDTSFETLDLAHKFYQTQIKNTVDGALDNIEYVNVNLQLSNHKDEIVHEFIFESIPTEVKNKGEKSHMVKITDYEKE